ncbi:MAG: GldG family protein [Chloroflexi bacterium]|nr:GldG family protein [Chloroflexota bacterium]
MQRQPIIIRRGHIATLASYVGVAALIAAVIGLIWQGGVTPYIIAAFVLGLVGIVLWAVMTPTEFRAFITGRGMRFGTVTVFSTLMLIGIVALAFLFFQRGALTLDLTQGQRFTLSAETEGILRRLYRPIRITGFYTSDYLPTREIDDQFFRLYETASDGLVTRLYIDPDEQPALASRYGVEEDGQVFVSYLNDDGSVDFNTLARVPRTANQERDITQAILRLLISGSIRVYFDTGSGERDPLDSTQEGVSGINAGMQESGLVTLPLDLSDIAAANGDIPRDAGAVLFVRPLTDLTDAEIAVVDRYLARGGALFIMTDVLYNEDPFLKQDGAFNAYLWANYGIRALDAAVVESPDTSGETPLDIIAAYVYTATSLGERLDPADNPLLFSVARALQVDLETAPADIANGQITLSSEVSYGETDLRTLGDTNTYSYDPATDLPPQLTTVVWSWDQTTGAKILMVGDSNFVSNGSVLAASGNGVLFTDGIAWLTGMDEQIRFGVQGYSTGVPLIFIDSATLDLISFITLIMMPGVVLVAGLAIWARRVRR